MFFVSLNSFLSSPIFLLIWCCTSSSLLPRFIKKLLSFCVFYRKFSILLQIRRILNTWLYELLFLQLPVWQLSLWRYWWVSVGLTYRLVVKCPSVSTVILVSKNETDLGDHLLRDETHWSLSRTFSNVLRRLAKWKNIINVPPPYRRYMYLLYTSKHWFS